MTTDVRPFISVSRASMTACSDAASRPDVGSSRIRIGVSRMIGAGDGDALALAAGQRHAALADHRVVAVGHRLDELVRVGQFGRAPDLAGRGAGLAVRDVLPDRRAEEQRVLQDEADLIAQRLQPIPPDVRAVDDDRPGRRIVEPRNQAHDRGLPGSRRTDNRRDLAGFDREADVLQDRLVGAVAEADVVELDLALELRRPARARACRGRGFRSPALPGCARSRPSPWRRCRSSSTDRASACTSCPDTAGRRSARRR